MSLRGSFHFAIKKSWWRLCVGAFSQFWLEILMRHIFVTVAFYNQRCGQPFCGGRGVVLSNDALAP